MTVWFASRGTWGLWGKSVVWHRLVVVEAAANPSAFDARADAFGCLRPRPSPRPGSIALPFLFNCLQASLWSPG